MAIIVETGAGIANANSYVSVSDAKAYAAARGKTFEADPACEHALILAADYLNAIPSFAGSQVETGQSLVWPRQNVYLNGELFGDDAIPPNLVKAQIELALLIDSGVELLPVNEGKFVIREKVGPIETQYSDKVGFGRVDLTYINALLASLLGYAGPLRTYRV